MRNKSWRKVLATLVVGSIIPLSGCSMLGGGDGKKLDLIKIDISKEDKLFLADLIYRSALNTLAMVSPVKAQLAVEISEGLFTYAKEIAEKDELPVEMLTAKLRDRLFTMESSNARIGAVWLDTFSLVLGKYAHIRPGDSLKQKLIDKETVILLADQGLSAIKNFRHPGSAPAEKKSP